MISKRILKSWIKTTDLLKKSKGLENLIDFQMNSQGFGKEFDWLPKEF